MALSLAWLRNLVRPGPCPNGPSNMRLAIAAWEKGASSRALGWVGEKDDRSDRVMHPSQVAGHDDPPYAGRRNEEAGQSARSWRDRGWAVRKTHSDRVMHCR